MSTYEPGVVGQVWLAPADDLSEKVPFIVDELAYSRAEAGTSRSVRLGDPIDLGPNSAWTQSAWYGGEDQQQWKDELMYERGSCDATERKGTLKLWPGWSHVMGDAIPSNRTHPRTLMPAPRGDGEDTELLIGGGNDEFHSWTGSVPVYKVHPVGGATYTGSTSSPIVAMSRFENDTGTDVSKLAAVLCLDGSFYVYDSVAGTLTDKSWVDKKSPAGLGAMVVFNDSIYMGMGPYLVRRSVATGGSVAWTVVKHLNHVERIIGMVVWNNRIWFGARVPGGETRVYASDGATIVEAFKVDSEFVIRGLVTHYGSLYLFGNKYISPGGQDAVGQIWRYNGASLSLVAEQGQGTWQGNRHGYVRAACSWGRFLVWGRDGLSSEGTDPGVMLYDAEEDAILEGPSFKRRTGATQVSVQGLCVWGDTLAACFREDGVVTASSVEYPWTVSYVRRDDAVKNALAAPFNTHDSAAKTQDLLSSKFDANLPGEKKAWLRSVMRCKIPTGTSVSVYAQFDEGTEVLIHTETATADTGWRQVEFPFSSDASDEFFRSLTLRYRIELTNTAPATYPSANPEVESISVMFQAAPRKRFRWFMRSLCQDAQVLADGTTAHPLTTRSAQVAKLVELWEAGLPLAFWEWSPTATTPSDGDAKYVLMSDFMEQPTRLTSDSTAVVSTVSFNLTEVT